MHGYTNNALEMLDVAYNFYKKGYSILLIDQRAHGKSDGIYSTHGFYERKDMLSWIDYLNDNLSNQTQHSHKYSLNNSCGVL